MRMVAVWVSILGLCGTFAHADDWPQWLGPDRDGVWHETGTIDHFPPSGPKVRWRLAVGGGYAGPAVANGRVFVTDRQVKQGFQRPADPFNRKNSTPGVERVLCINEGDGKILWTYEYPCDYQHSYSAGPRTTPVVQGKRVWTLGAEGDLVCLDVESGKPIWQKKLTGPDAPTPMWGFAGHPLIDGEKLICLTAGKNAVVTAFNKNTGDVIWSAISAKQPGYSPPMIFEAGGRRQLIVWNPESLNSLDPETGKLYWSQPFGPVDNGVSIVTPRKVGDLLMVSSSYTGSLVMKLDSSEPKATVLWERAGKKGSKKTDALQILMASPALTESNIYGVCINGELRCLDLKTGDRLWETYQATSGAAGPQMWSTAFIIPNGDKYFLANEHGDLIIAKLSSKGYEELSRAHLLDPVNTDPQRAVLWSHPAFANKSVYWRNDKELICVSLAQ